MCPELGLGFSSQLWCHSNTTAETGKMRHQAKTSKVVHINVLPIDWAFKADSMVNSNSKYRHDLMCRNSNFGCGSAVRSGCQFSSRAAEPAEIQCLSQGHLTRTEFRLKLLLSSFSSHLSICLSDFFLKWKKGAGNHFGAMKLFACTKDTTV